MKIARSHEFSMSLLLFVPWCGTLRNLPNLPLIPLWDYYDMEHLLSFFLVIASRSTFSSACSPAMSMSNFRSDILEAIQVAWGCLVFHFLPFLLIGHRPAAVYAISPCSFPDFGSSDDNLEHDTRSIFVRLLCGWIFLVNDTLIEKNLRIRERVEVTFVTLRRRASMYFCGSFIRDKHWNAPFSPFPRTILNSGIHVW